MKSNGHMNGTRISRRGGLSYRPTRSFRMRWTTFTAAEPSAYDEVRTRVYNREASRVSDEFLRCYRILTERTGDDPTVVKSLRMQDIILDYSLLRLKDIR